jgi:spermidine/putrescine transport system permease protein
MERLRAWFLTPAYLVMATLFAAPMLIVCAYSLLSRGPYGGVMRPWTLEAYARVLNPLYAAIVWRSVWISGVATVACLVLGFPLALFISRARGRRTLLLNLVMLPFWTSFLIRTYAWMFLLRDTGLVNTVLQALHLISAPLPLLFNDGAVILGLVYGYLPFMVLPLFATLEKQDPSVVDAAQDLGASPWVTLSTVIIPLARPGMFAGAILVFIPCLGSYLTPDLLGGGKTVMIGNLVQNQFTTARDWPFGAALSLLVMALVLVFLRVAAHRQETML